MQPKSLRLLFSIITRELPCSPRHLIRAPSSALFSTESNRSSRGERRRDDRSDDFFLRDLNFGDSIVPEKADKADSKPSSPIPGRPLRGERRMEGDREDLFPDFDNKLPRMSRGRSNKSYLTGEGRRGSGPFQQKFKSDFETNGESLDFLSQKVSPHSAERVKEETKSNESMQNGDQKQRGDRIGESLFQKLKLDSLSGLEKAGEAGTKKATQIPAPTASHSSEPELPPEDSDQIFKKMKETGLIPNAVAMLDGLCKDGLVQEAMKLFGLMREKGTIPEIVIYTAVVEGFCKAAKFDDAKRVFRKMQKNEIAPNAFSYSVLIQGLCKGKKLEDAVDFCMEMLDAGHSPNGSTFTGLVDLYCKEKGVKEAEELVKSLRERGFALDEKAIREHLDKKGPYSPMVWEAIFGKKSSRRPF
ncbi:pentatricopeptide repeat-containing protein At4g11690 [Phalaenopsis equestris]|uniref:pentatricopeptide repeat-containing protein At4g11690 n=1 Tax=Phalaenopsis equestris TaxID=78828 RepID=UPI0009E57B83|nr:pentatricopeptide repeat-containing protein At4g11690 [Phalaenopsis equestris]